MADQLEDILAEDFKFDDIKVGDIVWVNCAGLPISFTTKTPHPPVRLEVLVVSPELQAIVVNVGPSGWVPNFHLRPPCDQRISQILSSFSKEDAAKHCAWFVHIEDITMLTKKIAASNIVAKSDGEHCKACKQYYPYAEPNQPDGSLICYSCRTTRGWKASLLSK